MVKVTFGGDSLTVAPERANGLSVQELKEKLEEACDCTIPEGCEVLVNNSPSTLDYVITNGEDIRFTVSAGKKG